jgi:hypothetical protein
LTATIGVCVGVDGVDDLGAVDALGIERDHAEAGVVELALER